MPSVVVIDPATGSCAGVGEASAKTVVGLGGIGVLVAWAPVVGVAVA